jgi:hypothetical protein
VSLGYIIVALVAQEHKPMNRRIFGWDLPPGVTSRMIDEAYGEEQPCQCCGSDPADCICPECPVCGAQGNSLCYTEHGQIFNKVQRMGQSRMNIGQLKARIIDEEMYLAWLEYQPDDWKDK